MKKSAQIFHSIVNSPLALLLWCTATLLVPNIVLDCTESYNLLWKITNIALPAGCYLLFLTAWRRTGAMVLFLLPVMVLCAFQLVLSNLYGESIIAVDMFLNVVTTNYQEATELLANLVEVMVAVIILYIPVLAWAVVSLYRGRFLSSRNRKEVALWGCSLALFGAGMAGVASFSAGASIHSADNRFSRAVFPVNVVHNLCEAVERTCKTLNYPTTSADFSFHSVNTLPTDSAAIYLYVIGETSRAINWQLGGYCRQTNPALSRRSNLYFFPKAISESNTTHKSVPMLMSHLTAEHFDSIHTVKSIISAMKEAGFHTRFFSNQARNGSYTEFFGNEAHDVRYTDHSSGQVPFDGEVLRWVKEALYDSIHPRQFIVIHSYGSHFLYTDRYPDTDAFFKPDNITDASACHRATLINAYDNTIRYTDAFLDSIIGILDSRNVRSALLFSSDHGEDIFDDSRNRFLHASPNPTYYQLHVAMLAWCSSRLAQQSPGMAEAMRQNTLLRVSPQLSMFPTLLALAGVQTPYANTEGSLASVEYNPQPPMFVNDLNVAVPLLKAGLKQHDIEKFKPLLTLP